MCNPWKLSIHRTFLKQFKSAGQFIRHLDKAQGHEFSVTLGLYSSEEAANADVAQWTEFVNMANGGAFSTDDLFDIYKESSIFENRVQFITALHNKGIRPAQEWS
jgi:hypothetical protein